MSTTGRKPPTTPGAVQRRLIPERIAAGSSLRTVAAEFGLSHETVRQIAAADGVRSHAQSGRRRGAHIWTPDRLARVRQWRSEGVCAEEIARRLGTTRNAVYDALNRGGR